MLVDGLSLSLPLRYLGPSHYHSLLLSFTIDRYGYVIFPPLDECGWGADTIYRDFITFLPTIYFSCSRSIIEREHRKCSSEVVVRGEKIQFSHHPIKLQSNILFPCVLNSYPFSSCPLFLHQNSLALISLFLYSLEHLKNRSSGSSSYFSRRSN